MAKIEDELKIILEHTHNSYMFEMRCRRQKIIIQKINGQIEAYRNDDRDEKIIVDTSQEPFQKILKFQKYE